MIGDTRRCDPATAARLLWLERYPTAKVLFCGGSVVRGEGHASSDLDVVAVFEAVPNAWRESFYFEGWPVEVFAHDPATLVRFVQENRSRGRPSLAQMITEAIVVPEENAWSVPIRTWARGALAEPPTQSAETLAQQRYAITDLLNDLRDERPRAELVAVACALHPLVHNFSLAAHGRWRGFGKTLPRLTSRALPEVADVLTRGFEDFFQTGRKDELIRAVQRVLEPFGGEEFDGFRADAPASFRVPLSEVPWLVRSVGGNTER